MELETKNLPQLDKLSPVIVSVWPKRTKSTLFYLRLMAVILFSIPPQNIYSLFVEKATEVSWESNSKFLIGCF